MIQCFWGRSEGVFSDTFELGTFTSPFNSDNYQGTGSGGYALTAAPVSVAGTFKHLRLHMQTTPPEGFTLRYRLWVNGSPTSLTAIVVAGQTDAIDITNSVHVDVGDAVAMQCIETGNLGIGQDLGRVSHSLEFWSDVATECYYGVASGLTTGDGGATGVFSGQSDWDTNGTLAWNVVDTPGTITRMDVRLHVAPGIGSSKELAIYKNGVKQDGSGGTVDTRVTVANSSTTGSATFSLAVVPDDYLWTQVDHIGSPASSRVGLGFKFISENDYDFPIAGHEAPWGSTSTAFSAPMQTRETISSTTEADMYVPGPTTPMTITGIRVRLNIAPGTAKSRTLTVRRNSESPAGTPSVTLSDADVTGNAAGVLALTGSDFWNIEEIRTANPNITNGTWGFTGTTFVEPDAPVEPPDVGVIGPLVWVHWPRLVP